MIKPHRIGHVVIKVRELGMAKLGYAADDRGLPDVQKKLGIDPGE